MKTSKRKIPACKNDQKMDKPLVAVVRPANLEFQSRRQKYLWENELALAQVREIGLTDETIKSYRLGLSPRYVGRDDTARERALLAPVLNQGGVYTNQTVYCNLPGITVNPSDDNRWMRGAPVTYYAEKFDGQTSVLVLDDLSGLWLTQQTLAEWRDDLNLIIICSTHPHDIPLQWCEPAFWERFERVYLASGNNRAGDLAAVRIAQSAGREMRRVRLPLHLGETWTEFWQNRNSVEDFYRLLFEAAVIGAEISQNNSEATEFGRFGYQPVDIGSAFYRGHLYYPVKTLVNAPQTSRHGSDFQTTQKTARIETIIIRSDRTIHTVVEEPAPRGTPPEERVFRLTDGTIIDSPPQASPFSTWSWNSIQAFHEKRAQARALNVLLKKVYEFLVNSVWLPYEYDYALLTLLVPVTYAQAVFQSVPLVLVTGPPASGKSALGRAMCRLCANAAAIGQTSAATIARLIHESRGFVLLDDLESIGRHSSKRETPLFNELVQALKLSYNKETSWKIWTDVRRGMRVQRLNFFGVKMINNTSGTDQILGSRMLRVETRKIPPELQAQLKRQRNDLAVELNALRDELHTWTFENVALIDATYKRLFPHASDRNAEISAPLRVFADIAGDAVLSENLETALSAKSGAEGEPKNEIEMLIEAAKRLAREGYENVSATHVSLEIQSLFADQIVRNSDHKPLRFNDPAWVGRQLRAYGLVDVNESAARHQIFGKSLRVYRFGERFLTEIRKENKTKPEYLRKAPLEFCAGCANCRYRSFDCSLMAARAAH